MANLPIFDREQASTGEIIWTSRRLGEVVGVEENDGPADQMKRKFRITSPGVTFLSVKEFDALLVAAGWDLDGSHVAALEANEYDEDELKPQFSREKPQEPEIIPAPVPPVGEPMIPSEAVVHAPGIIQGPPPSESKPKTGKK